jgi:hypothetical protein
MALLFGGKNYQLVKQLFLNEKIQLVKLDSGSFPMRSHCFRTEVRICTFAINSEVSNAKSFSSVSDLQHVTFSLVFMLRSALPGFINGATDQGEEWTLKSGSL